MTFEAAKRRLSKIAKGEYHAIQYELIVAAKKHNSPNEAKCAVYIHGTNWFDGETWEAAFAKLKAGTERRKSHAANRAEQPL